MTLSFDLRLARILRLMVVMCPLLGVPVGPVMAKTVLPDLPERISPDASYIIYVHGRIIETQGPEAVSDRFGPYDFKGITQALSARGHIVIAQLRAPGGAGACRQDRRTAARPAPRGRPCETHHRRRVQQGVLYGASCGAGRCVTPRSTMRSLRAAWPRRWWEKTCLRTGWTGACCRWPTAPMTSDFPAPRFLSATHNWAAPYPWSFTKGRGTAFSMLRTRCG